MYSDSLNPFGMLNGRLVTVNDVAAGLACGCTCPACGNPLVARKGSQKVHHFGHATKTDCKGALETALHIKAKSILGKYSSFALPRSHFPLRNGDFHYYEKSRHFSYSEVHIEAKIGSIRPDVVLIDKKGHPFIVEIFVTHRCSREKSDFIQSLNLPSVEIDLRYLRRLNLLDDLLIENGVVHCAHTKYWINRPYEWCWP